MWRRFILLAAGLAVVASVAACGPLKNGGALPAVPPQTTIKVVKVTASTLHWFYHLDKRLIDCPPGRYIKEAYNAIWYVPLGRMPVARRIGYSRRTEDTRKCQALSQAIHHHAPPAPHPTRTVIVTVTPSAG